MYTTIPTILATGLFQSKNKFSDPKKYSNSTITTLRTVIDYELELFTSDGGIAHLNGCSYPIKKGNILISQPGDKRQSTLHFSAIYVHFGTGDKRLQNLLQSISGFHSIANFDKFSILLNDICETALTFEPDSDICAAAKLISFIFAIKKEIFRVSSSNPKDSSLSVVSVGIDFIKQNYMEPITVKQVAEQCCISASHFHKLFVETAHITPNKYINLVRLGAAKSLLYSTSISISEIAMKCGFQSQAYFSDCFKKHLGISPKDFRKSHVHPDEKEISLIQ